LIGCSDLHVHGDSCLFLRSLLLLGDLLTV
jgi:hypothetical protein